VATAPETTRATDGTDRTHRPRMRIGQPRYTAVAPGRSIREDVFNDHETVGRESVLHHVRLASESTDKPLTPAD
jgi:hypothetical protein